LRELHHSAHVRAAGAEESLDSPRAPGVLQTSIAGRRRRNGAILTLALRYIASADPAVWEPGFGERFVIIVFEAVPAGSFERK